jgi:hypothetical protein
MPQLFPKSASGGPLEADGEKWARSSRIVFLSMRLEIYASVISDESLEMANLVV